MSVVRMMQMTFHEVVDMIAVRYPLMTAVRAVGMVGLVGVTVVFRRAGSGIAAAGGDLMVVHVVAMQMMHVAVVQVIGVAVVPHRSVLAIRTMRVCDPRVLRKSWLSPSPIMRPGESRRQPLIVRSGMLNQISSRSWSYYARS